MDSSWPVVLARVQCFAWRPSSLRLRLRGLDLGSGAAAASELGCLDVAWVHPPPGASYPLHSPPQLQRALTTPTSLAERLYLRWRPYRVERTGSLPTSEVKRRRARLVLGWGTAREDLRMPPALSTSRACARPKKRTLGIEPAPLCETEPSLPTKPLRQTPDVHPGRKDPLLPIARPLLGIRALCERILQSPEAIQCIGFCRGAVQLRVYAESYHCASRPSLAAIPRRTHRISSDLRS